MTDSAQPEQDWSAADSAELYGINAWGAGYYSISDSGEAQVTVTTGDADTTVSLMDIVAGMRARNLEMPAVLRIRNVLDHRIKVLNEAFADAIASGGYNNVYRGVFPIKVNQQCHVIEEIANYGSRYHHGFEAGSKAELTIALSQLRDTESLVVCNGYKDSEFIDLGLYARRMGYPCFFVLESLSELRMIIERSRVLGVEPLIGVRMKSSVKVDGHWSQDSGDRSIFGLSTAALIAVVDELRAAGMLHCLQMLHCHLGSQVPNIRNVRNGVLEACRYYAGLVEEGAAMGYLDLGGGLAVDYEGARTNSTHSMNYQLEEYCVNIVESIRETFDPLEIPHPVIISESGRATVAYSSLLLFNVLDVRSCEPMDLPATIGADCVEPLKHIQEVLRVVSDANFQECYNDALFYRDEVRDMFNHGQASLRERAMAEDICLAVLQRIAQILPGVARVPPELENLSEVLSDIYYGNFSLFQSLPDIWAIDQLFPIMPLHRLQESPSREAMLADLTCDCDGKIDNFSLPAGTSKTLPLHPLREDEDYILGVFLVGAYQETLGDLHNLFGDTNVVNVTINPDGSFDFAREFHGDSISDVLSYVEYEPKHMQEQFRQVAESAVRSGRISVAERQEILRAFRESLQGYTYFEHH
ncbi:MAG: arginine decarboxylase [Haliea sp.]|jgi:arginine decarboxylase|uniref:biosynthetic arginine decarboxylase n=1 Tax=Haliea sp. TaxID=1932666 RepID=UPI000C361E93|nr:biosynthetic arginine decarboxylase [Haliea sp.]MBM68532.1 arginine decarboxylase [Haliea sp.]|tara:strand:+ start:54688 stop:56613 length:1926 start_codon:yes stop_codon:yes gene_type:complete